MLRELVRDGVSAGRLRAVGYAETRPIESNETPAGRAANRRVELIMDITQPPKAARPRRPSLSGGGRRRLSPPAANGAKLAACPAPGTSLHVLSAPDRRTGRPTRRAHAEQGREAYGAMLRYAESLNERGLLQRAESLKSDAEGVRLRVRDGERSVVDGPFAEAKEMIGGFFLLDCDTREEALALAAECPAAAWATVEVRELGPCFL